MDGHNLTKINLLGNPIANSNKNYKSELFDLIPTLNAIDGTDREGAEVESTIYGGEEDEEEEDDEFAAGEGEEIDDENSGEEYEGDEGDDDEDEEEEDEGKPNKKAKH